ncbi:hypothetical protein M422DRAFT_77168 [Sphaerobolus stellatus SS14]|uniref:Peptidase S28 n=1 Tax=Sphaerobolus stellatus (strain SS14) TaxID=990650 RepID=A0A0C9UHC4_SPHS4|nr:hypothetical protein M422DRAFT_77168 [Sphaerobolus stellatus SS14]
MVLLPTLLLTWSSLAYGLSSHAFHALGPQAVKLWRLEKINFTQPLDHFDKTNKFTFSQRFWVNAQFYQPGGPVILLDGGETSGTDRLPYISTGVAAKIANATGGLALVLEHRYYGNSIPVANFSTDSLRWLTNEQAMADSANFMANVNLSAVTGIPGDFTAPKTPYIYYGGSYAGARSAHMKVTYPNLVYGAIASSGVTHAAVNLWEYYDVIRNATPQCSPVFSKAIETVNIALSNKDLNGPVKDMFGLTGLTDADFASVLADVPLGGWQNSNWDPSVGSDSWTPFCEMIAKPPAAPAPQTRVLGNMTVDFGFLNLVNYIQQNFVSRCLRTNQTIADCFSTANDTSLQEDDLSQTWRPWQFQVCTAWGFFMVSPPPAGVPPMVATPITIDYLSEICKQAYPPGEHFKVPPLPNVEDVNRLGGFFIAADRLAIVDGELDPWRPATAHSSYAHLPPRQDTTLRPFKLIPQAVHHYDENGLADQSLEPPQIQDIHNEEIAFVKAWLKDFKPPKH